MKKYIIMISSILFFCLVFVWLIPYIRYEILTMQHGYEFWGLEKSTQMLDESECLKVLAYSEDFARVYYVSDTGDILTFSKIEGEWALEHDGWETVWSKTGSADGFIWPYFYHSSEGILVFLLLLLVLFAAVAIGTGTLIFVSKYKNKRHKKQRNNHEFGKDANREIKFVTLNSIIRK